ncbi:MAG: LuxR C-terminal-related transcriptional regulator [Candidatus Cryptobacteroides sp.]|nr:LuxR C-terminal-related transcriptional regulator [Candidatus Cryptobacteroides sp.]
MKDKRSYKPEDRMLELVRNDSELILIMGRFGISLGFGEGTVREVCRLHDVDELTFLAVVNYITGREYRCEDVSLPSLIRYLKQSHEYFLDFNLPNIRRKLIESVDCSGASDIAMLIIRFYDDYVMAVRKHMDYEDEQVFTYVQQLLNGQLKSGYAISEFAKKHSPISDKLKELKDVIIRCYPEKNNYLLNAALLEIIACEQDLTSHCMIEDNLFVPSVRRIEQRLKENGATSDTAQRNVQERKDKTEALSEREKDIVRCVAKGMSNKEIADALFLSVHTVTTHRRNISNKLQIHTAAGLTIYAISNKLLNLNDIQ